MERSSGSYLRFVLRLDDERSERRERSLVHAMEVSKAVDHGAVRRERCAEGLQRAASANCDFVRLGQLVVDGSTIFRLIDRERNLGGHGLLDRTADCGKRLQERPIHTLDTFCCIVASGLRRGQGRGQGETRQRIPLRLGVAGDRRCRFFPSRKPEA